MSIYVYCICHWSLYLLSTTEDATFKRKYCANLFILFLTSSFDLISKKSENKLGKIIMLISSAWCLWSWPFHSISIKINNDWLKLWAFELWHVKSASLTYFNFDFTVFSCLKLETHRKYATFRRFLFIADISNIFIKSLQVFRYREKIDSDYDLSLMLKLWLMCQIQN